MARKLSELRVEEEDHDYDYDSVLPFFLCLLLVNDRMRYYDLWI